MAYNNYDFYIPQNGSIMVELVDDVSQYSGGVGAPLPISYQDLGYSNPYSSNRYNMNAQTGNLFGSNPYNTNGQTGNLFGSNQSNTSSRPSGVMRWGPAYTIIGPHQPEIPAGGGVYDPNLVVPGIHNFNIGIY
ncbi:unnamed protein product [Adineta steineri]|uniref:Uncharacterized protein n=1 Tax=Adineta steineri TaxID=433720 RepID=A0A814AHG4_9BILA|nr:unnamed protein product [Adineta steineri]CAF3782365.1 unnamed protein product [Adineta steineri]